MEAVKMTDTQHDQFLQGSSMGAQSAINVFYCAYGSNLYRSRFLKYIEGGIIEGSEHMHPGARDRTLPQQELYIRALHPISFRCVSSRWGGGGVCFLEYHKKTTATRITHLRGYKITLGQFCDVVCQENAHMLEPEALEIDVRRFLDSGERRRHLGTASWYPELIRLGEFKGIRC
jgi:histone deacetylase 4/5